MTLTYDGLGYPQAQTGVTSISTVAAQLARRVNTFTVKLTFQNDGKVTSTGIDNRLEGREDDAF